MLMFGFICLFVFYSKPDFVKLNEYNITSKEYSVRKIFTVNKTKLKKSADSVWVITILVQHINPNSRRTYHLFLGLSITSEQTPFTDEDRKKWLKATKRALSLSVRQICFVW